MKPETLADKCPRCGRHSLHKVERYCLADRCGYSEPLPEAKPKRGARRKS